MPNQSAIKNSTPLEKKESLQHFLIHNKQSIQQALPSFLSTERMIGQLMTTINANPKLLEATPRSLIGALLYCGSLGLEPGPLGHVYLIPFNNRKKGVVEVQIIPSYKGLVQLARRSDQIAQVGMGVVWEGDEFEFNQGTDGFIHHKPDPARVDFGKWEDVLWVYAWYKLKGVEGQAVEVLSGNNVEWHRKRYSKAASDGPWVTAWDQMAQKTAMRKLLKLAPMATEMHSAIALDEMAETQLSQESFIPDLPPEIEEQIQEQEEEDKPAPSSGPTVPSWAPSGIAGKPIADIGINQLKGLAKTLTKRGEGGEDNPVRQEELGLLKQVNERIAAMGQPSTAKHVDNPTVQRKPKEPSLREKVQTLKTMLMDLPNGKVELMDICDSLRIDIEVATQPELEAMKKRLMERIGEINQELSVQT